MKKIYIILLFGLFGCHITNAQKLESGDLSILSNEKYINMVLDFTDCMIDGKPADYKIKDEGEEDWSKGVADIIQRFAYGCVKHDRYHRVGNYPNANYSFIFHFIDIDDDEDCKGYMEIVDNQTKQVKAKIVKCYGSAGSFGSFYNLVGDAMENLGGKIGKLIKQSQKK